MCLSGYAVPVCSGCWVRSGGYSIVIINLYGTFHIMIGDHSCNKGPCYCFSVKLRFVVFPSVIIINCHILSIISQSVDCINTST